MKATLVVVAALLVAAVLVVRVAREQGAIGAGEPVTGDIAEDYAGYWLSSDGYALRLAVRDGALSQAADSPFNGGPMRTGGGDKVTFDIGGSVPALRGDELAGGFPACNVELDISSDGTRIVAALVGENGLGGGGGIDFRRVSQREYEGFVIAWDVALPRLGIERSREENGRYPTVEDVRSDGATAGYTPCWPVNPFEARESRPGTEPGDYSCTVGKRGYTLTFFGPDREPHTARG